MVKKFSQAHTWLLPVVLILFILQIVTLPFVVSLTYSGRSESPDRIITYSTQKLTWDKSTDIREDGSATLSLFNSMYLNARSGDSKNILAPGTEGDNIIRLKNQTNRPVCYTAVVYEIKSSENLDIVTSFNGINFKDTAIHDLPKGVKESDVLRAVSGTLGGGRLQDFDIDWKWAFEEGEQKDLNDTSLGNKDIADDVVIGFYLVVEDEGEKYIATAPETGDYGFIEAYALLMCLSGILLAILIFLRIREKRGVKNDPES